MHEIFLIVPAIIIITVLGLSLVFLPTIIAIIRKHRQILPILVLNTLLWWTFIAWAVALVWAFIKEGQENTPQAPGTQPKTPAERAQTPRDDP